MRKCYLLLLFVSLLLASCVKDDSGGGVENYVNVGDRVPSFTVNDGRGGTFISGEGFLGKRSLLVFFATTCPDCARALPVVQEAWDILKTDPDYQVIAIARQQTLSDTNPYWEANGFDIPKYHDPDRSVYAMFANSMIPRLYIINEQGIVKWMAIESLELTAQQLADKVQNP